MGIIGDIFGLARDTVSLTVETARFGINTVRDCVGVEAEKQPVKKVVRKRKPKAKAVAKKTTAKRATKQVAK